MTYHQQLKKTIKTKCRIRAETLYKYGQKAGPELHRNFIRLEDSTLLATSNAYLDIISCHILYIYFQNFKANEQLSKKKISFLFLLKSWENAE